MHLRQAEVACHTLAGLHPAHTMQHPGNKAAVCFTVRGGTRVLTSIFPYSAFTGILLGFMGLQIPIHTLFTHYVTETVG